MGSPAGADRAVYFLHIPKTACTSLRRIVAHYCPPPGLVSLYPPFGPGDLDRAREQVAGPGRIVFGHLTFGIDRVLGAPGDYVTFLREPVARVVSYYRHNLGFPQAEHHALAASGAGLRAFVESRVTHETNNHMTRILAGHADHAHTDDDALLERALENVRDRFRFVGTSEAFESSVQALCRVMGWDEAYPRVLPRENRSKAPAPILDDATREVIERENRLDMLLYGELAASPTRDRAY